MRSRARSLSRHTGRPGARVVIGTAIALTSLTVLTTAPPSAGVAVVAAATMQERGRPAGALAAAPGDAPDPAAIKTAVDSLRADPDLGPERTIKSLRWNGSRPTNEPTVPRWLAWVRDFARWVDQSARVLVWIGVGLAAVLLLNWLLRSTRGRTLLSTEEAFVAPSHVRELDIRPEVLPADIGAAARVLWDGGDHRGALALLYRGLLSRLVHVHRVPIRASSTEGDCLAMASDRLSLGALDYAARLVRAWQQAIYGHQAVPTPIAHVLCADFAAALAPAAAHGGAAVTPAAPGAGEETA